ncbi:MAG: flagellar motor protein MotB [Pacificimonas sp.]
MHARSFAHNQRPIIRRRARRTHRRARHVNQQWKIAYADFATAMMAFFMLLWLMSHSEKVSLQGVADYFAPSNATMSNSSGAGSILAGAALGPDGAKSSGAYNPDMLAALPSHRDALGYGTSETRDQHSNAAHAAAERKAKRVRTALADAPLLAAAQDRLKIDATMAGTRIELTDNARVSMFETGAVTPNAYGRSVLTALGGRLATERQRIAIAAHTDGTGSDPANWRLSSGRALAVRDLMARAGVDANRFAEVSGKAAAFPLFPMNPLRAENRRVTILLLDEPSAAPDKLAR